MVNKKKTTVEVPISELALHILAMDDAYPNVGMGMFPETAVGIVLHEYGLKKSDVDYDAIIGELMIMRSRR